MSINSLFPLVLPHKCSPPTDRSHSDLNCVVLWPMLPDITMALPPTTPSSWVPSKASPLTVACAQSNTSWSICRSDSDITNVACSNQCHSPNCNTCNQSICRPINVGLWHSFDCQHCVLNSIQHHSLNSSYVCVSSTPFSPLSNVHCQLIDDAPTWITYAVATNVTRCHTYLTTPNSSSSSSSVPSKVTPNHT